MLHIIELVCIEFESIANHCVSYVSATSPFISPSPVPPIFRLFLFQTQVFCVDVRCFFPGCHWIVHKANSSSTLECALIDPTREVT